MDIESTSKSHEKLPWLGTRQPHPMTSPWPEAGLALPDLISAGMAVSARAATWPMHVTRSGTCSGPHGTRVRDVSPGPLRVPQFLQLMRTDHTTDRQEASSS